MNDEQNRLRKAAILIDSLDPRSADALLDHMDPLQAERVRHAVMELEGVSRDEREQIMSEFLNRHRPNRGPASGETAAENDGIEIDQSLADRLARGDDEPARRTVASTASETPFRFLHEADGKLIAQFLDGENPQTIAVVLAHLPPARAADALARLAKDRQTEVIRRIAHLDETPAEVLRDVETALGSRVSEQIQTMRRRTVGLAAVRQIFSAATMTCRKDLLAQLAGDDATLAEQLAASLPATAPPSSRTASDARPFAPQERAYSSRRPAWLEGADRSPIRPATPEFARRLRSAGAANGASGVERSQPPAWQRPAVSPAISRGWTPATPAASPPAPAETRDDATRKTPPGQDEQPGKPVPQANSGPARPGIEFDDLSRLSDSALATLFAQVDIDVALLALTGANPDLVQRLTQHLPARQARLINKRLSRPGPLRLRDIERAQADVARLAAELAENKQIAWPAPRERLAAAA